nr:alpha-amylase family glycosyl hydrolase [Arcicella sp.]
RDFYIWKEKKPNNWISFFSGSAWEFDSLTDEYYLHLFLNKQPDLNWENPKLRQEIYTMMKFWLDKGVNGFRMDVISVISKDLSFPDFPEGRFGDLGFYANGPKVHDYLQEMNREVLSQYDCMTVGEAFGVSADQANLYVGKDRKELNMIYHFDHAVPRDEHCFVKPQPEFTLVELKSIFSKWDKATANNGWNTVYFGNHDNPRMLSRFGNTKQYWQASAKMLATVLLTLKGTPYLYQGDEIGMTNAVFNHVEEYNDVQVLNAYQSLIKEQGHNESDFLEACGKIARDHARTPMQWNSEAFAGFTTGTKTWLKVNENYSSINVETQALDENSILNYYKKLIQLRKNTPTLIYGDYDDLRPDCNAVWAYTRKWQNDTLLIIHNFTESTQNFTLNLAIKELVMITYNLNEVALTDIPNFTLKPFESNIYQIF